MAIRLIVTITAAPGKGSELAEAYKAHCAEVAREPGCQQFKVFQSVVNPDKLTLLERWTDQGALDAHARLQDLVDKGVLIRTGALKGTRYHLNIEKEK